MAIRNGCGADADCPTVDLGHAARQGETEPHATRRALLCARRPRRIETIERRKYLLALFGRDPRPLVGDTERDAIALTGGPERDRGGAIFRGVLDEVPEG